MPPRGEGMENIPPEAMLENNEIQTEINTKLEVWKEAHPGADAASIKRMIEQHADDLRLGIDMSATAVAIDAFVQSGNVGALETFAASNFSTDEQNDVEHNLRTGARAVAEVLNVLNLPIPNELHVLNDKQLAEAGK